MRAAAIVGALLLVLPGAAWAGSDDGDPSRETEEENGRCPPDSANETSCKDHPPLQEASSSPWMTNCKVQGANVHLDCVEVIATFGSSERALSIRYEVDAANVSLLNFTVNGLRLLESIRFDAGGGRLDVRTNGLLRIGDRDSELLLHNDPTGLVRFKGDDGSIALRFPADAFVEKEASGPARVTYPDGSVSHWQAEESNWFDDATVEGHGFATLFREADESRPAAVGPGRVDENGRNPVAADVNLGRSAPNNDAAPHVVAYDDLDIKVRLPRASLATTESPIRVEVSADLDSGRTIALNLDPSMVGDPDGLQVRYFDVYARPDQSRVEVEQAISQASGLEDILNPNDDTGQAEFWLIQDQNGLQVLVSIPHWSTHAVAIAWLDASAAPDVTPGIVLGLMGGLLAAVALFWPRSRQD